MRSDIFYFECCPAYCGINFELMVIPIQHSPESIREKIQNNQKDKVRKKAVKIFTVTLIKKMIIIAKEDSYFLLIPIIQTKQNICQ